MFPRERSNPDGTHPFAYQTLIWRLQRWARICDVREEDGARAHVTPYRFRHALATRMINNDVHEIAVQQMLDHNSPTMTGVYAKLHDRTLRAHYDRYQERINIRGQVVVLQLDGPLSDAAWSKERFARAKLLFPTRTPSTTAMTDSISSGDSCSSPSTMSGSTPRKCSTWATACSSRSR